MLHVQVALQVQQLPAAGGADVGQTQPPGMSPTQVCLSDLGAAPDVMDFENMWSSVDTEQDMDGVPDEDELRHDLEWLQPSSQGAVAAQSLSPTSLFEPLFVEPICVGALPIRPQPRFHSAFVASERDEHDSGSSGSSGSSEIMRDLDTTHETADGSSTPPTPSAAVLQQETLPARCPFCGNVPIVPGQGVPDKEDRRPVGGVLEKGRYKVRAAPRKENRLAQW